MQRVLNSLDVRMWLYIGFFAFALYLVTGDSPPRLDAYTPLAQAFLDGRLHILRSVQGSLVELIPVGPGQWYVPYPPAPALPLMPIVAVIGTRFDIGVVGALFGALSAVLMHAALRSMGVRWATANWLTVGFAFGTVLWWAAGKVDVWLYAQLNAVFFSTAALLLALRGRWPVVAGALLGAAAASRLPVGLTLPVYLALYGGWQLPALAAVGLWPARIREWLGRSDPLRRRMARLLRAEQVGRPLLVLVGLAVPATLVALYNLARFGSPFDFGYERIPGVLEEFWYSEGILHWSYIPRHIWAIFLSGFDFVYEFPYFRPSWWGLSLVITTPIYLWLVFARSRQPLIAFGWIAVALALVPIVTHGTWGWAQFGYRFSLDIAPILWLMLGWVFRERMSGYAKIAILIGVIVNAYGVWVINQLGFVDW